MHFDDIILSFGFHFFQNVGGFFMVAFENENQSKSKHNSSNMSTLISSVKFMFIFLFFIVKW